MLCLLARSVSRQPACPDVLDVEIPTAVAHAAAAAADKHRARESLAGASEKGGL